MKRTCFSLGMLAASMWAATAAQAGGLYSAGSYGSAGSSGGSYGSYGSSGGSYGSSGGAVVLAGSHGSSGGSSGGHAQKKLDRLIYKAERQAASHGSSGGSYGSHGSSGGSYGSVGSAGSYGSSGSSGGVSHKLLRKIDRAAEKVLRKSASHGSSGGSSGGYSSYGSTGASYGSTGSHGSYGQLHTSAHPVYASPAAVTRPVVAAPAAAPEFAYVVVQLPEDATLFLGGNKTSTNGAVRKFKVPVTDTSRSYPYAVRAELTRNGQVYVAESTETLVAGETLTVKVNDVASAEVPVAAR